MRPVKLTPAQYRQIKETLAGAFRVSDLEQFAREGFEKEIYDPVDWRVSKAHVLSDVIDRANQAGVLNQFLVAAAAVRPLNDAMQELPGLLAVEDLPVAVPSLPVTPPPPSPEARSHHRPGAPARLAAFNWIAAALASLAALKWIAAALAILALLYTAYRLLPAVTQTAAGGPPPQAAAANETALPATAAVTTTAALALRPIAPPSPTFTPSPTASPEPNPTSARTATQTFPPTHTVTATATPSATPTPTDAPTPTRPPATRPRPTSMPRPSPTAPPPPAAPSLLEPANGEGRASGDRVRFVWRWDGPPLEPGQAFEVRLWRSDQRDHLGAAALTGETSIEIDLGFTPGFQQGGPGLYLWTVVVASRTTEGAVGPEASPHQLTISIPIAATPEPRITP